MKMFEKKKENKKEEEKVVSYFISLAFLYVCYFTFKFSILFFFFSRSRPSYSSAGSFSIAFTKICGRYYFVLGGYFCVCSFLFVCFFFLLRRVIRYVCVVDADDFSSKMNVIDFVYGEVWMMSE